MRVNFNEQATKHIVESYYRKYEDFVVELGIKCNVRQLGPVGRSLVPIEVTTLSFELDWELEVGNGKERVKTFIEHDDVENAFKIMLGEKGYVVKGISFDCGDGAVKGFNGVNVDVSTKVKKK